MLLRPNCSSCKAISFARRFASFFCSFFSAFRQTKLEEQQKMEFAAARKRLDEEEEKLDLLFRRKANYEEEGRRLREDSLNVQDILDNRNALIQMDDYIAFQRIQVSKAEDALEVERQKLQEAVQVILT